MNKTQPNTAEKDSEIFTPGPADEALYRVFLKRCAARSRPDHRENRLDWETGQLERHFRDLCLVHPVAVAEIVAYFVDAAKTAWEDGNNSGDNAKLQKGYYQQARRQWVLDRALALVGIVPDWGVGLYPVFSKPGSNLPDEYSTNTLPRLLRGVKTMDEARASL